MKNKLLWFLVLVGIAIRLLVIFDQKEIIKLPDSELYLTLAKDYYHGNFHPDLVRTPGYPLFIYLVFLIFGWGKLKIIFIIQHFLTLLSSVLIYKILEKRIPNRKITFTAGLLIFTNYSIIQWGQILMPEALLIFFTCLFIYYLFHCHSCEIRNLKLLFLFFSFTILLILGFIKPLYLSFSLIYLVYIFLSEKKHRFLITFQFIALVTIILLYMQWNKDTNHFFGISTSDSTTVFGKIVNFKMEKCSSSKKNSVFRSRLQNYLLNDGKRDWYQFVYSYKKNGWGENLQTFQKTYSFNNEVVKNCPVEYFVKSTPSTWQTLFSFKNYLEPKNTVIHFLSRIYFFDFLLFCVVLYSIIIHIHLISHISPISLISLFILYNILSIFLFAADSFYRLRVPFQLLFFLYLILFFETKEDKTEEKIARS